MRTFRPSAALVVLLSLSGALGSARADDPPKVSPRPAPAEARRGDLLEALAERLLSEAVSERSAAEREVAQLPAERLRALALLLRDRLAGRAGEDVAPSGVAVEQEATWAVVEAAKLPDVVAGVAADADPAVVVATPEAAKRFADALASGGARVLTSPRLTTYDRQRGVVEVVDQRAFVADVEVTPSERGPIADPVVDTVRTGLRLEATPRVLPGRSQLAVRFLLDVRRLVEPVAEESVLLADGAAPLKVQRPEVLGARWERTVSLRDGADVLVVFPRGFLGRQSERLVLRYRAHVVDVPATVPAGR